MHTTLLHRRTIGRLFLAGVAGVVSLTSAALTHADEAASLAQTISYDAAEVWSETGPKRELAPLSSAYYEPSRAASANNSGATLDASLPTEAPGEIEPVAAGEPCSSCSSDYGCGGAYPYNRCGCSSHALFPWFTGPGACDDWCVGPHWEVAADGLILFREGVNFASIPANGFTPTLTDQFDYGPGGRVFVTGYNENRFGMQVGYEGVNDFHANALYSNGAGDSREITYESNINSVEVNFIRRTDGVWRPFAGGRYIELHDNFVDFTTVAKAIPAPADPPVGPTGYVDTGRGEFLKNRLIGMQGGAFRDMWRLNRWITLEPFGNAGLYLNDFQRTTINRNVTTIVTGDDLSTPANEFTQATSEVQTRSNYESSELAFVGEAGLTGVLRLSRCVALRGGYQVLAVNGVGRGIDAFLAPGLDPTTLVYHGGHFGIEYVR